MACGTGGVAAASAAHCVGCDIRGIALCGSLAERDLGDLSRISRRRHVRRGETLLWAEGDSAICAHLVSGAMKLSAVDRDGTEQIVGLLIPGDLVGQPFRERADHTATALTDTEVCVAPRGEFERMLDEHPEMERALLVRTLSDLVGARRAMVTLARAPAMERVAGFLMAIAARAAERGEAEGRGPATIDLPLGRGQLAGLLGLTIETVSRQFARLKADRIIAVPSRRAVTILAPDLLKAAAEGNLV